MTQRQRRRGGGWGGGWVVALMKCSRPSARKDMPMMARVRIKSGLELEVTLEAGSDVFEDRQSCGQESEIGL